MKINYVRQPASVDYSLIDYFICSSGFETRSSYLYTKISDQLIESQKICFFFSDRVTLSKKTNDKIYKENNFLAFEAISENISDYINIFSEIFANERNTNISILIDYSSMTTNIYAAILKYFYTYSTNFQEVSLYFSYTQALFSEPQQLKPLTYNQPISIFDTIQTTEKPIALIIGLGYERDKTLGLLEYFQSDRDDVYLFLTDNSADNKFYELVKNNNANLIKLIEDQHIIRYNIRDVSYLLSTLDSLINYLIYTNYRIVIAPTGPKQFTLISLIVNLFHEEVTTYRLSHGNRSTPIDKIPDTSKDFILTQVNFKEEAKTIT